MDALDEAVRIAESYCADVPDHVDVTLDKNAFAAGYLAAAGGLKQALTRLKSKDGSRPRSCIWLWTPEDNAGFWTAQCKEDWPVSLLHDGATFCPFCGGRLIVES